MEIHGDVASGFEAVRDAFAAHADLGGGGAAYAAYHRGELVVDLWAGDAGGRPWQRETRGTWMSVGKALTTLCVQMLVDRGELEVDAPVATYWPEFAGSGKDRITVRHMLTHTAGIVGDPRITKLIDLEDGTGFDREEEILAILEDATPAWEPGEQVGYHALTFSWILGELVRRVDGRSLGTFLREEVALPLGVPDVRIGTPVEEHHLLAPMLPMMFDPSFPDAALELWRNILEAAREPESIPGLSLLGQGDVSVLDRPEVFDSVPGRIAELGGTNLTGTARGVARIMAALVDGSEGLVSRSAFDDFAEIRREDPDLVLLIPIARGTGYWRNKQLIEGRPRGFGPNEEAIGHTGFGGQIAFADRVASVGAAMVRSHHTSFPLSALMLNTALYDCIGG